ncbi:MAG: nicotinate phosphoribosyltransferase, partial [Nitrosomonadaceae bacterium]|nr:nicotinate phosphoribosyltransferase [Nitrosomonadaceae bacterium]
MPVDQLNPILLTDSYKLGHHQQEVPGTTNTYSYFESRVGAKYPYTVFFGLQMLLKRYLEGPIVTRDHVKEAQSFSKEHFMGADIFNLAMWEHIVRHHEGRIPLSIRAVHEGTRVPVSNVMMDVCANDDRCASLTNFFESLLTHVWHPSNVATISNVIREKINAAFKTSVDDDTLWLADYMLHDFGFRGCSSVESAGTGGAGHLVNFKGTDTLIAIKFAQLYYGADMAGYSVPASEHSIMTAMGPTGEYRIVDQLIARYPKGILSVVSDSYNIEKAIEYYGTKAKAAILARDGKFVVRPDSPRFKGESPASQVIWIAQQLERYFGATVNKKGYRVLNPKVGIIYGDGLKVEQIFECIDGLMKAGYSASTCVYGMGGGLLQKHDRDTQRNAFK